MLPNQSRDRFLVRQRKLMKTQRGVGDEDKRTRAALIG